MQDNNGFRGLYRGLVPSVLGIVPYAGIDLMVFFTLKERWVAQNKTKHSTPDVLTLVRSACIVFIRDYTEWFRSFHHESYHCLLLL